MEELELLRVREKNTAFAQYLPGNMREKPELENWLCVGVVYEGRACGAAVAEMKDGLCFLRYVYVDPSARLCGLGTYLLRGLVGLAGELGASRVKAIYSPSMLENGGQSLGILQRAGFSASQPIATCINVRLGNISLPESPIPEGCELYDGWTLPQELIEEYRRLAQDGVIPDYANVGETENPIPELCSFCAVGGHFAGAMLVRERDGELFVSGIYVVERFRSEKIASALIAAAINAARPLYPPESIVSTQNITRLTIDLCSKLFGSRNITLKETELIAVYDF